MVLRMVLYHLVVVPCCYAMGRIHSPVIIVYYDISRYCQSIDKSMSRLCGVVRALLLRRLNNE